MKVIIVGGASGGAACAARLRRLDERAEIIVVERGPHLVCAGLGVPHVVPGAIDLEPDPSETGEQFFRSYFAVDARTHCEAISISASKRVVALRNVVNDELTHEPYDKLVLARNASSVRPALPGIDLPGIFWGEAMPEAQALRAWVDRRTMARAGLQNWSGIQFDQPRPRAVVIGGGHCGLENAKHLKHAGFDVTLVERRGQVLAPLDGDFACVVHEHLARHGLRLALGEEVAGFKLLEGGGIQVRTNPAGTYETDIVVLALGSHPDTSLAISAGLRLGEHGGVCVDEHMRTSNPDIFAVGDSVEVRDFMTGGQSLAMHSGSANHQGRIAADVIAGRDSHFRGTLGTSLIELPGGAAAWTGLGERTLNALGDGDYEKIYLFPDAPATCHPDIRPMALKFIFRKSDGVVLGAQALGEEGAAVDKRISTLAVAIQMGATIYDLQDAELCCAHQLGHTRDAINFAGRVAADVLDGDMPLAHWDHAPGAFLLDVRQPAELGVESVPGAKNIPLPELRARLGELPRDREILVVCRSAQRAYYATRILLQNGYKARSLSGGMMSRTFRRESSGADSRKNTKAAPSRTSRQPQSRRKQEQS